MAGETKKRNGIVFAFSAPSGGGKTTLSRLIAQRVSGIRISVSHTTRPPRGGETDGVDYHFVSEEEFISLEKSGIFLETAVVHGYRYGTSVHEVMPHIDNGVDVLLDIDVQGTNAVRAKMEVVSIFIIPPTQKELEKRLFGRKTEKPKDLELRLTNARREIDSAVAFDYLVINNNLTEAVTDIGAIIRAERMRVSRNKERLVTFWENTK